MTIALDVFKLSKSVEKNKQKVIADIDEAYSEGSGLIVFPEMCITGLVNLGNIERDKNYAFPRNDPFFREVMQMSFQRQILVALGFLEFEIKMMYDSYMFIQADRRVPHLYRRMSGGWRTPACDPSIYREGHSPVYIPTSYGVFTILICRDLFEDSILKKVTESGQFDYVINPIVRHDADSGERLSADDWGSKLAEYGDRLKRLRCKSMMVNLYGEDVNGYFAFGGACVFSDDGKVIAEKPPYEPGILYAEI